jgi:hypothetical protein
MGVVKDAGHSNGLLPRLSLQAGALQPEHIPVVGREYDNRILLHAKFTEGFQQPSHLRIDGCTGCVVGGNVLSPLFVPSTQLGCIDKVCESYILKIFRTPCSDREACAAQA